jgi:hypothetical protein
VATSSPKDAEGRARGPVIRPAPAAPPESFRATGVAGNLTLSRRCGQMVRLT